MVVCLYHGRGIETNHLTEPMAPGDVLLFEYIGWAESALTKNQAGHDRQSRTVYLFNFKSLIDEAD
jgi:hypothetical protein